MNTLTILRKDHIYMRKLLKLLDSKLDEVRNGGRPNLTLMAEAVDYIGSHANQHHHPLEDIVFEYFALKSTKLGALVHRCHSEHEELALKTRKILNPIRLSLLDGMLPMEIILDALEDFLSAQKQHLIFEEQKIFPLIEEIASEEDWQGLSKKLALLADIQTMEFNAAQFQSLHAELAQATN